jgi:hypothetical protein
MGLGWDYRWVEIYTVVRATQKLVWIENQITVDFDQGSLHVAVTVVTTVSAVLLRISKHTRASQASKPSQGTKRENKQPPNHPIHLNQLNQSRLPTHLRSPPSRKPPSQQHSNMFLMKCVRPAVASAVRFPALNVARVPATAAVARRQMSTVLSTRLDVEVSSLVHCRCRFIA